MVFLGVFGLLIVLVLPGMQASHAQTQSAPGKRIALLIGNAAYKGDFNSSTQDWNKLQNAAKDAQDIGNELKKLGFRVDDVEVLQNIGLRDMRLALARFSKRAEKADQVVFYFSGHGAQDKTLNYLVPVDAPATDRELNNLSVDTIRLDEVLDAVSVGPGNKVVMIDACRTLPGAKGYTGGLANPESKQKLPAKTVVVFAAAAGQRAMDGRGQANGYFAQGLLLGLRQNDTSLRNVIDIAEAKVLELSLGKQEVTPYGSSLAQKVFAFAPAKTAQPAATVSAAAVASAKPGGVIRDCDGCPTLVVLPAGKFLMGSSSEAASKTEYPARSVDINRPFALGKFEVTFKQWAMCSNDGACRIGGGNKYGEDLGRGVYMPADDSHPVQGVLLSDVAAYLKWLSKKTGQMYRLPSASEWEYAGRAGTSTDFWWGNEAKEICQYENVRDLSAKMFFEFSKMNAGDMGDCYDGHPGSAPSASGKANPWGFHNMLGNVAEIVADCAPESSDAIPTDGAANSKQTAFNKNCQTHTLKGGSYVGSYSPGQYFVWKQRVFIPHWSCTEKSTNLCSVNGVGFRVARELLLDSPKK